MSNRGRQAVPRRRFVRRGLRLVEHLFAATGVVLLLYHVFFDLSVIASNSMSPALQGTSPENGDWVLTEKITFLLRDPRRWEVMAFRNRDGAQVMKRVVGLPGESLSLSGGALLVAGRPVARPHSLGGIEYLACGKLYKGRQADCGEGHFVLGDDSHDSLDSRFEGPVSSERITGRAWLIVWPPERIGFVNP